MKAPRRACRSLCSKSSKLLLRSFRPSASKETEPKQAPLRPAPSQVLELPGGAPGVAHARRGTAPPLVRKYVGKIFAAATTIASTNQSKRLRGSSMTATGQSEANVRPPCPPSQISVNVGTLVPCLSFRRPVPLLTSLPGALTRRRGFCDRTVWRSPRATILKSPPFRASNLAAVSRTDWKISTLPGLSKPLKRQFLFHLPANPLPVERRAPFHPGNRPSSA